MKWSTLKYVFRQTGGPRCRAAREKAGAEPAIAMGRQPHHPPLSERFADAARGAERPDAGRGDGTSVRPSAHFHGQGFHAMLSTGFHGKLSAGSTAS